MYLMSTEVTVTPGVAVDSRQPPVQMEPLVVIRPRRGLFDLDLSSVWHHRQLLYFFFWRDVKVRYKQTAIGAGWAILQPLTTMTIFTVIFGHLAKIPSDGFPYAVFAYTGLLPWTFFAASLTRCSASVVGDGNLVSKVFFPRLIMPLAGPLSGLVDFAIGLVILGGLMGWYGLRPSWALLALPLFLLLAVVTALAVGLFLAALNVRYRDVGYTVPFVIQIWMYMSPIVYPVSLVPERWRLLYSLNPMAGVIEGFRWALLGKAGPDLTAMLVSTVVIVTLLGAGVVFFKRHEPTFADFI
jgi:homopolymeric O-antigen transport system permease protein